MAISETVKNLSGFVKIWKVDPKSGSKELLVDQKNLVLYGGAKLCAYALGGVPNSKVYGMLIGFNNSGSFTPPPITLDYSSPFSSFSAPFGYLREPLTYAPSFLSDTNYEDNTVLFTSLISSSSSEGGASFISGTSRIYEVALISALNSSNSSEDVIFSRTSFNPIVYDNNYNLVLVWGIKILVS